MNNFYASLFGIAGAILLTTGAYGYPYHNGQTKIGPKAPSSGQMAQAPQTTLHKNDNPPIKMQRGSFSADLSKWNVNPQTVARNLHQWLGLKTSLSFEKITEKTDDRDITHALFQGYYKGVAVEKTSFMLHSKDGKATFISGHIANFKGGDFQKHLSKDQALSTAKDFFKVTDLYKKYPVQRLIMRAGEKDNSPFKLAYKIKVVSVSPFVMSRVYVDAQTGEIIKTINLIRNLDTPGNGETLYDGNQDITVDHHNGSYRLRESDDRKIETYDATHLTGISFSGQFNGVEDFVSDNTDFSGAEIDNLEVSQISGEQGDEFYVQIKDFHDEDVYTSNSFSADQLPMTLADIDQPLYNTPVTVEFWKQNNTSGGEDSLQTSFEVNFSEGDHLYDDDGFEGTYAVSSVGNPALDAHWGMEQTYDFYADVFGRNSYDGNNSVIKQYLNPPADVLNNYIGGTGLPNNAFAMQDPFNIMVYGLGDNQIMGPVVGIDIEGHEFSHMVIDHNGYGGLDYQGESGALNESFADILGTCIEFYADVNPNWTIGENVALYGDNFRSMSNPKNPWGLSQQPDTYQGDYWIDPNSFMDNGGVHTNSGVQNYWFYLVSEGGSGTNDLNDTYDVQGIGIEKAREIVYRNIMNYLSSTSGYMESYAGSLEATKDLYGIPSEEYTAVSKAWYAVGIGDNPEEYCGGQTDLTEVSGTFDDGSGSGHDYVNNAHCTWLIHPEGASHVTLTFPEFNTEEGADYVVVYDGTDNTAPVLAEYSGNYIPDEVVSNSGSMFVEFYSDQANKKPGWTAHYTTDLGVDSHELDRNLNVFPNPTQGDFTVHSDLNHEMQLSIFDITGKQVSKSFTVGKGDNPINVSDLSAGIYFLEFNSGKHRHVEKLIVE